MQEYDWTSQDIVEEIEDIDPNCNEHLDGEPMNELELLAAKNAIINSKMAKVVYKEPLNPAVSSNIPMSDSLEETKRILTQKKKRWPFSFIFKKPITDNNSIPRTISPVPPTPTLSPASSSSTASPAPHYQIPQGNWAFFAPMAACWIRFDPVNQQKITFHVHSNNTGILYLLDSHLCHGQIPTLVLPFQGLCYHALDYMVTQIACLRLAYVPNHLP
ncbi:hypothetical protein G6F56_007629 [Rhizopus delemar]|nr:hypothetical protein G6F56_007629 [Rhizopus delemar]